MYNLRSFLEEEKNNIFQLSEPISINQEITAIQEELDSHGKFPIIFIEKPIHSDGSISKIPLVCNLTASREITSRAPGINNHKEFAKTYSALTSEPIEPKIISDKDEKNPRFDKSFHIF